MANAPAKREEPYQFRQGSKKRGATWTKIAENLSEIGMKASQRSVREKFEKIVKEFKCKEAIEERASGIDAEYTERGRAMVDILERMSECEMQMESNKEKENREKETAEEMRKKQWRVLERQENGDVKRMMS